MSVPKRKFIIDTDAGIDDAEAILMALNAPDVDIIAITTVQGNTNAPQVGKNVLRILKLVGRLDVCLFVQNVINEYNNVSLMEITQY